MSTSADVLVLRGGYRIDAEIVEGLLDLEFRGIRFTFEHDGSLRIGPRAVLTVADRAWLAAHHEQVKAAIAYCDAIVEQDRERERERGHVVARAMPA